MLRESFDELLGCLPNVVEEDAAESLDVERRVSLDLQLAQVVLNDGAAVLQEQATRLQQQLGICY